MFCADGRFPSAGNSWHASRPAVSTVAASQLPYSIVRHHAVSQSSPYGSRRAQGRMAFKNLGALFLQPRSQGRYSAADFRGISTEHMMRSLGKKLAWRREWIVQQTPRASFAFARGAVAAAILMTTLT